MESYIEKFERVVDLLRPYGTYTSTFIANDVYELTSNVEHSLAVGQYVTLDGTNKVRVVTIVDSKIFRVDAFGQTVGASGTWKGLAPYSDYGTRKTINRKLLSKNAYEHQFQKFPLIALRLPAPNEVEDGVHVVNANILFATFTNKQYIPQERIANVFKPILWPLVAKFLEMCKKSGEFVMFRPGYTQIDRLFYGTESGEEQNIANVFDDPLDAVELRDLELNFIIENCI